MRVTMLFNFRDVQRRCAGLIALGRTSRMTQLTDKDVYRSGKRLQYCATGLDVRSFHTSAPALEKLTIKSPPFQESIVQGDIFFSKQEGDEVERDEVIASIETDKLTLYITSPASGILEKLLVKEGDTIEANVDVATIDTEAAPRTKSVTDDKLFEEVPAPTHRKEIQPHSVEPSMIPPTVADHTRDVSAKPVLLRESPSVLSVRKGSREEYAVKMSRMRLRIAENLKNSQHDSATLSTFNEADMSRILNMRKKYSEEFKDKHGIKLGMMSMFMKASVIALSRFPALNGSIDGQNIVYRKYIDIGFAVSTGKGLVVPVLKNVEDMSLAEIELAVNEMGKKARDNRLTMEDLEGGTFTISNGGIFGGMFGTPILSPKQSAILGIYGIKDRPIAVDGKAEIRPMMYMALSYDHRLVDGREAVLCLSKIKEIIEDPIVTLLDL